MTGLLVDLVVAFGFGVAVLLVLKGVSQALGSGAHRR